MKGKLPRPAPAKRPDPDPVVLAEVLRHLRIKIKHSDKTIMRLREEADYFKQEHRMVELTEKMLQITSWLARRRALIEVWEVATNVVWTGSRGG